MRIHRTVTCLLSFSSTLGVTLLTGCGVARVGTPGVDPTSPESGAREGDAASVDVGSGAQDERDAANGVDAGVGGDASARRDAARATADGASDVGHLDGGAAGRTDAAPLDASVVDVSEGEDANASPGVVYEGRFDTSDPAGPQMGWPGTSLIARFDGTAAEVQLTQIDGYSGGPSWFDVVVDGVVGTAFSVTGTGTVVPVASGLTPGVHVLELDKRTEANLGVVRFEGFTFTGGAGLLAPPLRPSHRIEFLSDSTIDGYGVLGNIATTCPTGDPPQYNDSRSSVAFFASSTLDAEMTLSAYSGKGLTVNESPDDTEYFGDIYPRALPDSPTSAWTFTTEIPDAVVLSLGGVDMDGLAAPPAGFQAAYDALVGTVRGHYPDAAIWLTVWSQIPDSPVATRTAMTNVLQSIVSARAASGDTRLFLYVFPEATPDDGSGCEGHGTVAHEQAMGTLLAAQIKQTLGW